MTADEWVACEDEHVMLWQLGQLLRKQLDAMRRSEERQHEAQFDRRLQLFMVACCRRVHHLITHEWHRFALDVADSYELEWERHWRRGVSNIREGYGRALHDDNPELDLAVLNATLPHELWEATDGLMLGVAALLKQNKQLQARKNNTLAEVSNAALIRDIFGNPFRPVAFDPAWRSPAAVELAAGTYEKRNFLLMPTLADALEAAGCADAAVLGHCRDPDGVHVRGCWVVDGVLGLS